MNDVTAGYKIRIRQWHHEIWQFTSYQGCRILTTFSPFVHPDSNIQRYDCRENKSSTLHTYFCSTSMHVLVVWKKSPANALWNCSIDKLTLLLNSVFCKSKHISSLCYVKQVPASLNKFKQVDRPISKSSIWFSNIRIDVKIPDHFELIMFISKQWWWNLEQQK